MKKLIITTASLLAVSSLANAENTQHPEGFFFKPELGIDYSYSMIDIDKDFDKLYTKNFNSINLSLGSRIHKHIGVELNMSTSDNRRKSLGSVWTHIKYQSIGTDINLYQPINNKVEAFASAGFAFYEFDIKAENSAVHMSHTESIWAPRIGAGMQYKLNDKFAIKSSINHAFINDADIDALTDIKVGLRYSF